MTTPTRLAIRSDATDVIELGPAVGLLIEKGLEHLPEQFRHAAALPLGLRLQGLVLPVVKHDLCTLHVLHHTPHGEPFKTPVWWADLDEPIGSEADYRRPVVVVQGNALNRSRIGAAVCVPLTSNLRWVDAPGNVLSPGHETGLARDSVATVSLIVALDKQQLTERVRKIPRRRFALVLAGIDYDPGR